MFVQSVEDGSRSDRREWATAHFSMEKPLMMPRVPSRNVAWPDAVPV